MKTRFNSLDISAIVTEINSRAIDLRLINVYDVDHKTYLFKFVRREKKEILLVESGTRLHLTEFEWPKGQMPSGFAMKLRKHLRGRRLVSIKQLGVDRIVDLQFGSDDAAYHLIVELYDRGNIALTDCNYKVLILLRFRKETQKGDEDVTIAVHETYPIDAANQKQPFISINRLEEILKGEIDNSVKRVLNPNLPYGTACIDHALTVAGLPTSARVGKEFVLERDLQKLHDSLKQADDFLVNSRCQVCKGYIIQKAVQKSDGEIMTNIEFHPYHLQQHKDLPFKEFDNFNKAVDEFYGTLESQKSDLKVVQREKAAMKKLENVRKDHEARIAGLQQEQDSDRMKASLIEDNLELVDQAIRIICSAIANQVSWDDIMELVRDAQSMNDHVAMAIKSLKFETNSMMMSLTEASYSSDDSDEEFSDSSDDDEPKQRKEVKQKKKPVKVEIDLSLTAYGNVQKYYTKKRQAANKEQKTMDASTKALKSAEKKTMQTLKEAATIHNIQKARKNLWFEKFIWFISSENYLIIGGRDAQQNETLVKKYLKAGDIYVHADLHGATSCIVKAMNPNDEIPPKTLNEAGTMAICHSAAWSAKVVTSAWWVHHHQVSKTAPSGEYLTTGSFLIRGKKNYLPPSYLVYGFGFLFKVDETCVWRHKGERRVRTENELLSIADTNEVLDDISEADSKEEVDVDSDDDEEKEEDTPDQLEQITSPTPEDESQVDGDENESTSVLNESSEPRPLVSAGQGLSVPTETEDEPTIENPSSNVEVQPTTENKSSTESVVDLGVEELKISEQKSDSDEEEESAYPDTVLKMQYATLTQDTNEEQESQSGNKTRLSAKQKRDLRKQKKKQQKENEASEGGGAVQQPPPIQAPKNVRSISNKRSHQKVNKDYELVNTSAAGVPQMQPKRGQKKKLQKIKEKYKDQDEEDRQMMMEILQSANAPKEKKGKKGRKQRAKMEAQSKLNASRQQRAADENNKNKGGNNAQNQNGPKPDKKFTEVKVEVKDQVTTDSVPEATAKTSNEDNNSELQQNNNDDLDSDDEREMLLKAEHLDIDVENIVDSLTGSPHADDVIMFAIPVCAPYNSMQNYKYKVKMTPGNSKKGKATKTALGMFQNQTDTNQQEKDHFRSVKDYDLARNLPGKVKLSAPNLSKQSQNKKKKNKHQGGFRP